MSPSRVPSSDSGYFASKTVSSDAARAARAEFANTLGSNGESEMSELRWKNCRRVRMLVSFGVRRFIAAWERPVRNIVRLLAVGPARRAHLAKRR
jgi:hypothetical protein